MRAKTPNPTYDTYEASSPVRTWPGSSASLSTRIEYDGTLLRTYLSTLTPSRIILYLCYHGDVPVVVARSDWWRSIP